MRDGHKMIGASFNKVASSGIELQSLKPVGYENASYFIDQESVMGEFEIKVLNNGGALAIDKNGEKADYAYNRSYDPTEGVWLDDGVWTYLSGEEPEGITFDAGQGLWFFVVSDAYAEGTESYSLQSAGEAMIDSGSVLLRDGHKGVVATLSRSVPLQKITVSGYENASYFIDQESVMGEFEIKVLNNGGALAIDKNGEKADYAYNRSYDPTEGVWLDDGVWTYLSGEEPEGITFGMGEGLWAFVVSDAYAEGTEQYYLEFPGLDDLAE